MPKPVSVTGRTSSITKSFVNGIISNKMPNSEDLNWFTELEIE